MLVQFTIPRGTVELGRVIDTCIARCVERWGGCTVTDGLGYWRNPDMPDGVPIDAEPVAILCVECSATVLSRIDLHSDKRDVQTVRAWFDNLAVFVRDKGEQHTVYYQMFDGGEARFVGQNTIVGGK